MNIDNREQSWKLFSYFDLLPIPYENIPITVKDTRTR